MKEAINMFDNRNNMIVVRKHRRPGLRPFYFSSDFDDLFEGFRGEMEKLARDPWTVAERNPTLRTYHRQNMMPMDFRDAGDRYMLSVELPGVDKDDVKIRMDDDILTLKVEGREEKGDYDESIDSSDPRRGDKTNVSSNPRRSVGSYANESGDSSHLRRGISSESVGLEEEENFLMKERSTHNCERCLRLPSEVIADDIKARMENGVLSITIPKVVPKEKEVKEITVE